MEKGTNQTAGVMAMDEEAQEAEYEIDKQHDATRLFSADSPQHIVDQAREYSDALAQVVEDRNLITTIQGRKHVQIEGWTLLGSMVGVFPVTEWTRFIERGNDEGCEARVVAKRSDGSVVGAAEASCMRSEPNWQDSPDYAIRSMAQTRAASKALRMPLGFIVTLAGYQGTPAEEMTEQTSHNTSQKSPPEEHDPDAYPEHGKHAQNGDEPKVWRDIDEGYLEYCVENASQVLSVPAMRELRRREDKPDEDNEPSSDGPQGHVRKLISQSEDMDVESMMGVAETTVVTLKEGDYDETEAWREVYRYLQSVIGGEQELSINENGEFEIIPF